MPVRVINLRWPDATAKIRAVPKAQIPSVLRLRPVPEASHQARRHVRAALTALGAASLLDAAELGVSELVTNACLHARTSLTLTVSLRDSGAVRIEVSDDSPVHPKRRRSEPMMTNGRGLRLLSAYGEWGVTELGDGTDGKTVWFEPMSDVDLPRQPSRS
jgi:anti-sigma regulatory factor (Ser/Thr protein kinase)